ncbi:MAG: hypothetical protein OQJ81_09165 [Melioribacteraceae bacterium]|nr:hypothetical protein [Melioribacteraceae bacterium]
MESLGYIFGMAGLSFALIAWERIAKLKKEFDSLKEELSNSGLIKVKLESEK